jgi:hypothetical protein
MNHRPFEDWLLAEEPLTSDQKTDLQDHLKTCSSCTALAEVNLALRSKKTTMPEPGFSARFQSRLAARRSAQRLRNFWGIFILAVGAVGMMLWLFFPYFQWASLSPMEVFITWITTLSLVFTSLLAYGRAGSVILRVASDFVPVYFWVAAFTLTGLFGLLWVGSIRKFANLYEGEKL